MTKLAAQACLMTVHFIPCAACTAPKKNVQTPNLLMVTEQAESVVAGLVSF